MGELLQALREDHIRMAILVDEYGGMAGVLTVEDIVEEIVGELQDELDREPYHFRLLDERTLVVSGQMRVEEANDELHLDLPEAEEYETVAGFILTHLQRLPSEGEAFRYGSTRLRVNAMRGPRIEQVEITRLVENSPAPTPGPE